MESLGGWLRSLGLGKYEASFRENEIDETVLPSLTEEHLKQLGVTALGHRVKLLDAIAALRTDANAQAPSGDAKAAPGVSPSPEDRAERRQVTVMFTDLVDSTALSTRLDPEDLRAVMGTYHRCVAETVGRFNGFVAKYMGDGVLTYFGYPRASEHELLMIPLPKKRSAPMPIVVTTGIQNMLMIPLPKKRSAPMPIVVTTGIQNMTPAQYDAAIASLAARAQQAASCGLRSTAKSWRERAVNLPRPAPAALPYVFAFVSTRIICAMFAEDPGER